MSDAEEDRGHKESQEFLDFAKLAKQRQDSGRAVQLNRFQAIVDDEEKRVQSTFTTNSDKMCTTEAERSAALLRFLNTSTDDRPERDQGQNCLRPYDVGMEALQAAHGLNNEVDQCCKRLQSVQPTQRLQIPWENEFQYLRSAITQQTLNAERQIRELLAKGQGGSSGILYPATESTEDGQWFGCSNLTRGVKKGQGCDLQWVSWGAAAHGLEKGVGHLVKDFSDSTMT